MGKSSTLVNGTLSTGKALGTAALAVLLYIVIFLLAAWIVNIVRGLETKADGSPNLLELSGL